MNKIKNAHLMVSLFYFIQAYVISCSDISVYVFLPTKTLAINATIPSAIVIYAFVLS